MKEANRVLISNQGVTSALAVLLIFLIYTSVSTPRDSIILPLSIIIVIMAWNTFTRNLRYVFNASIILSIFFALAIIQTIIINGIDDNLQSIITKMLMALLCHLVIVGIFYGNNMLIRNCVNVVLLVFVAGFYLQLIVFYNTNYFIDLRYITSGVESKIGDSEVLRSTWNLGVGLVRVTSFFNEPGTYCSITIQLLLVSFFLTRKLEALHLATVASLFLTFSTFGIVLASCFLIYSSLVYYKNKQISFSKRIWFLLTFGTLIATLASMFAFEYISGRFLDNTKNDGGLGFRMYWLDAWLNSELDEKFWGMGLGFFDQRYALGGKLYLEDIGMWFQTVVSLGILSLLFIALLWWYSRSKLILFGVAIILLSKNTFYGYPLILTLGFIYSIHGSAIFLNERVR